MSSLCCHLQIKTSKTRLMDAGMISALKRRYQRSQLQYFLDKDEKEEADLYKFYLLIAIDWTKAARRPRQYQYVSSHWSFLGTKWLCRHGCKRGGRIKQMLVAVIEQFPIGSDIHVVDLLNSTDQQNIHKLRCSITSSSTWTWQLYDGEVGISCKAVGEVALSKMEKK